jgi:membrane protease YdiL (CAAX protease family)
MRSSPFDRLRVRGLLTQIVLLCAAEAIVFNLVRPRGARITSGETRLSALIVYCSVLLVLIVRGRAAGLRWPWLLGDPPTRQLVPLLSVVAPVALVTLGAAVAVYIPLSYVAPDLVRRLLLEGNALTDARTVGEWLQVVAIGAIAAPIVEELFFRGFLLSRWSRRWGTPTGVVASSALFAVLHGEWLGHFVFGVAMAALYLRTRRLWMPIAAHAINNGVIALFNLSDILRHAPPDTTTLEQLRGEWPIGAAALVAGAWLFWWYLGRFWPVGSLRAVLSGPVPYDVQAALGTAPPDSTSAS